jgi:membrane protein DedA with SNARE-associated domain
MGLIDLAGAGDWLASAAALAPALVDTAGAGTEAAAGGIGGVWHAVNQWIVALAGSPWALVAVYVVAVIDGFFPPVPSETLVVATATVYAAAGEWWVSAIIWAVGAFGAVCGDCIAFSLGRWFDAPHWRIFQRGKGHAALEWARRLFVRGAAPLLMVARFIPVGRVAVNLTAGTVGYPMRRFVLIDSAAAACWSCYAVLIGFAAGKAMADNPLLAVLIGIAFSVSVGSLVQWLMNRHYGKTASQDGTAAAAEPDQGL